MKTKPGTRTLAEAILALIAGSTDFESLQENARASLARLDEMWEVEELDNWPVLPEEPEP